MSFSKKMIIRLTSPTIQSSTTIFIYLMWWLMPSQDILLVLEFSPLLLLLEDISYPVCGHALTTHLPGESVFRYFHVWRTLHLLSTHTVCYQSLSGIILRTIRVFARISLLLLQRVIQQIVQQSLFLWLTEALKK